MTVIHDDQSIEIGIWSAEDHSPSSAESPFDNEGCDGVDKEGRAVVPVPAGKPAISRFSEKMMTAVRQPKLDKKQDTDDTEKMIEAELLAWMRDNPGDTAMHTHITKREKQMISLERQSVNFVRQIEEELPHGMVGWACGSPRD